MKEIEGEIEEDQQNSSGATIIPKHMFQPPHFIFLFSFWICGKKGWAILSKKLSTADISAFLQLIGKLSLSEKIDLGIIEKLSLSKMCI